MALETLDIEGKEVVPVGNSLILPLPMSPFPLCPTQDISTVGWEGNNLAGISPHVPSSRN